MAQRKTIAIDATSLPPQPAGAGTYILNLVRALARIDGDHDYVVYCRSHSLPLFAGLPPSFAIVDAGHLSRGLRLLWEETSLPWDLRRRSVNLLHSPHHTTPLLYSPCPRVITVHDVTFFLLPERYPLVRRLHFQVLTLLGVRRAKLLVVPSVSVREDTAAVLRLRRDRIRVTYEGVEPAFRPLDREASAALARDKYGLPDGYLLSLGTREPGKNRMTLFRALTFLREDGHDIHLAVVGQTGWKVDEEQGLLVELGLQDRVHFTGYVPQADLPALYNGATAFVFPSLYEGFGLPVLEAMACGVPVITSNVSALPEVAGGAALLVDPHDAEAIARAIARVIDEPALARLLARAGIERAAEFTWERCAAATLDAYREVLGESS